MLTFQIHTILIENPGEPDVNPNNCWWFYYNIVSGNNRILLSSRAFPHLRNCINHADVIREYMRFAETRIKITPNANRVRKQKGERLFGADL